MSDAVSPDVAAMRVEYAGAPFDAVDLAPSWDEQFDRWLADAVGAQVTEPNAMVLGTVSADGRPHTRNVLAKQVDAGGVVFYTNYESTKSTDLGAHPVASATFSWLPIRRQVHVRGRVEKVDAATTQAYWQQRPRGSQIGAWASTLCPQSSVVPDRATLDDAQHQIEQRYGGLDDGPDAQPVPVPPRWGGWRIVPDEVEFWQGREGRLHDRLRFRINDNRWVTERLAP